jgi:hypothetical protein
MILSIEMILKRPNPFVELTSKRRDIWPSRTEAYNALKIRPVFRDWDDKVLKNFVVRQQHSYVVIVMLNLFVGAWSKAIADS